MFSLRVVVWMTFVLAENVFQTEESLCSFLFCLLLCLFVRLFVCSFVCLFVCSTFRNRRHLSKKKSGIHLEKVQRKQKKIFKKFILFQMITAQPGDQFAICLFNQIKSVVYSIVYSIFLLIFYPNWFFENFGQQKNWLLWVLLLEIRITGFRAKKGNWKRNVKTTFDNIFGPRMGWWSVCQKWIVSRSVKLRSSKNHFFILFHFVFSSSSQVVN